MNRTCDRRSNTRKSNESYVGKFKVIKELTPANTSLTRHSRAKEDNQGDKGKK